MEGVFEPTAELLEDPALAELLDRIGPDAATRSCSRGAWARTGARARFVQGRCRLGRRPEGAGRPADRLLRPARAPPAHAASAQLELLDGFGGATHGELRGGLAAAHRRRSGAGRRAGGAPGAGGHAATASWTCCASSSRRSSRSGPSESEEADLLAERERLRRLDALVAAAGGGRGGDRARRAASRAWRALLAEAERLAGSVAGVDPALDALAARLATLRIEADDLGGELRRYASTPGGRARAPRGARGAARALRPAEAQARRQRRRGARARRALPREARRAGVGPRWSSSASQAELAEAAVGARPARRRAHRGAARRPPRAWPSACAPSSRRSPWRARSSRSCWSRATEIGASGAERVELLLAPNPGVPAAPLRESASGGELSRVMLALMTVAGARRVADARVRRGGRRRGRPDRARRRGAAARARARRTRCSASRTCPRSRPRPSAHFRIEKTTRRRAGAHHRRGAGGRRRGGGALPDARRRGLRRGARPQHARELLRRRLMIRFRRGRPGRLGFPET